MNPSAADQMSATTTQRHYPIPGLDFRDFWDICSKYQRIHPGYRHVSYTIDGLDSYIVLEETDVALILRKLSGTSEPIRKYVARFYTSAAETGRNYGTCELIYRPIPHDEHDAGLYYFSDSTTKLSLFNFENIIYSSFDLTHDFIPDIEFGTPCEVLACVIDMRGFSLFCEKPSIESPYTCGLMNAFYHTVQNVFFKYPPELVKFLGDGVLAIWETSAEDRQVAIDICVAGSLSLNTNWQAVRRSPHFSHGAPEAIGVGVSFGLASKLPVGNDYIGRPVNIASRLCGVCPGGRLYIDKSVPKINSEVEKRDTRVRIKSFGEYNVWMLLSA